MSNRLMARMAFAFALIASTLVVAPGGASAGTGGSTQLTRSFMSGLFSAVISKNDGDRGSYKDKAETVKSEKKEPKPGDDPQKDKPMLPGDDSPVVVPGKAPAVGKNFNAAASSGKVRVRLPGSKHAVELTEGASLPVGTIVDARYGVVKLTTSRDSSGAVQTARFSRGVFAVEQAATARPMTEIVLRGGHLGQCRRAAKASAVSISKKRRRARGRRLWAEGRGRFRTRGSYGVATVRGTGWITTDTCSGTRVTVRHGLVAVRDFRLKKTVMVPGGKSYLAKRSAAKR